MTKEKKVASFCEGKIGVTPSVAASGDTNPSDATVNDIMRSVSLYSLKHFIVRKYCEKAVENRTEIVVHDRCHCGCTRVS